MAIWDGWRESENEIREGRREANVEGKGSKRI
jgi:hypothetical protein